VTPELVLLVAPFLPVAVALGVLLAGRQPNRREAVTLLGTLVTFGAVASLFPAVLAGERPTVTLLELLPGLPLRFELEPLGLLYAAVAATLWIPTSVYSIGYLRGRGEAHQTGFFAWFALSIGAALGVAFAANLLTLFVFYELLTLSTYPLVTHRRSEEARQGGRVYLGVLLFTSIGFLLFGIIWTWQLAGTLDFRAGGILAGRVEGPQAALLLGLFAFGIGKAALMPFHRWLPAAMVAPTPVSALLHAVAVVKAGVFCVLKVVVYVFGIDFLAAGDRSLWLMWVASGTLLAASLVALFKDNLKARLAYSTVSQLAYIVLGAALATPASVLGAGMHVVMHAAAKITLFFCAGAIDVALHKKNVSELDGIGRRMPFTMGAFALASLSIIGLPPFGGVWSKWYLGLGAVQGQHPVFVGVLMLGSLLSAGYLLPVVARAFYRAPGAGAESGLREAPLLCVVPLCLTAVAGLALFFLAPAVERLLAPLVGR